MQLDSVGSTNAEAMALGRAGEPGGSGSSPRADRRTGRRGRHWASPPGNLAASLLLIGSVRSRPLAATARLRRRRRAARDALAAVAGPQRRSGSNGRTTSSSDGAKLAGILLEDRDRRTGSSDRVVVGFGVNVGPSPRRACRIPRRRSPSSAHAVAAETVFAALRDSWAAGERLWDEGRGMAAIRGAGSTAPPGSVTTSPFGSAPIPCAAHSRPSTTPASSSCVPERHDARHRRRRCAFRCGGDGKGDGVTSMIRLQILVRRASHRRASKDAPCRRGLQPVLRARRFVFAPHEGRGWHQLDKAPNP